MLETSISAVIRLFVVATVFCSFCANADTTINVFPNSFSPANVQINVGETVTWVNQDDQDVHTITSANNSWPQYFLFGEGDTFSVTFNAAGTYQYSDVLTVNMSGTITVIGAPVNVPPTISFSSPTNNAKIIAPATFTLTANASDSDGTVTNVSFYLETGPTLVGSDTSSPFQLTISNLAAGTYTYYASATDNSGASTLTAQSITVYAITNTVLSSPAVVGTNFIFDVAVINGHSYSVESSTNLAAPSPWPVVRNFTAQSNVFHFTQPRGIDLTNRFFRVRSN